MRYTWTLAFLGTTAVMSAQSAVEYHSAKDVTAMIAKAKTERKPDQGNFIQPLGKAGLYVANLEYRVHGVDTPPLVHEDDAEFVYVVEGGGTLTTGGKLRAETRGMGANRTGTGIDGGTEQKIAKGDFFMIQKGTPHMFNQTDGTLVIASIHLPVK